MTVKQLIQALSTIQDQDTIVMVKGYEDGYDDIDSDNISAIYPVALNVNDEWYYGKHQLVKYVPNEDVGKYTIVNAIIL